MKTLLSKIFNPMFYLRQRQHSCAYLRAMIKFNCENRELAKQYAGTNGPLVSIIVPLFNQAAYLMACIDSIKAQSYRNWECIIVDDASTDNSLEIVKKIIHDDPRFSLVELKQNNGPAVTRNTGIAKANGELITFLDGDDLITVNSLLRRVECYLRNAKNDRVAGTYSDIISVFDQHVKRRTRNDEFLYPKNRLIIDFLACAEICPLKVHSPLIKTEIVRKFGGFNEQMIWGAEDWYLWQIILRHGYIFIPVGCIGGIYRQHQSSVTRNNCGKFAADVHKVYDEIYSALPPEKIVPGTPEPYLQPLSYYLENMIVTQRLLGDAVASYLNNDKAAFMTILNMLPTDMGALVEHHISLQDTVDSCAGRFYCLPPHKAADKISDFSSVKTEIISRINSYFRINN
jgi:glycosyltransferase involved in cell wall biosynthesis